MSIKTPIIFRVKDPHKYIDCKRNLITHPLHDKFTTDIIQINHYHHKSVEEQLEKQQRGTPDRPNNAYVPPLHTLYNHIIDNTIADKYLDKIKNIYDSVM
jgi:hypothetical protein